MPDNITFDTVATDIRTPGQYVEVRNTRALRGLPNMNRRVLFIGNKLPAGAALTASLQRINSAGEAAGLFGRGSVLHEMLVAARAANKETDFWAIGLADDAGGVQATQTVTVTGAATAPGTVSLYINGQLLNVGVSSGDAAAAVATAIAAKVNAYLDGPFTAAAVGGVVTLTHRHKGAFGSDADVRVNYQADEKLPAGIQVAIAAGVAGAGNPDVAAALAAISEEVFYTVVCAYGDATNVAKLEAELNTRWGGMDMRTGHLFVGKAGTHSDLTTYGSARNSVHTAVLGVKKPPQGAYNWNARMAAVVEFNGAIDPARPFQTLVVPGLMAPARSDRFTRQERELLLRDGISTFTVDQGGNVLIERVVTTYQVDAYGIDDVSYLDLETKWTADYIRFSVRAIIARRFPRHKLADDGTNFAAGQPIATPNLIKGELLALGRDLELAGILEDFEQFKKDLIALRSISDVNRVNSILVPNLVNQFRVFAASVDFIL